MAEPLVTALAESVDWNTPPEILEIVRSAFGGEIYLDPCSNPGSLVNARVTCSLPDSDGLKIPWRNYPSVFINPPFGVSYVHKTTRKCISAKEKKALQDAIQPASEQIKSLWNPEDWERQSIADWVKKAAVEVSCVPTQTAIIMLIPAATDTAYWQEYVFQHAHSILFLKGRPHFWMNGKRGGPARMACALAVFGEKYNRIPSTEGTVIYP